MDLIKPSQSLPEQSSPKKLIKGQEKDINQPKRTFQPEQDTVKFETLRKIQHMDSPADNEDTTPYIAKCIPKLPQFDATARKGSPIRHEGESRKPISPTPLKTKFAHLLPDYMREFNLEQRTLLKVQGKLDQHLLFMKSHRGKNKGDFFKSIRRNLIQSCNLFVELQQIKQILFLANQFYLFLRDKDSENCFDVLIDLPKQASLSQRKDLLTKRMREFIKSKGELSQHNTVQIPLFRFPFEETAQLKQKNVQKKKESAVEALKQKVKPFDILSKSKNQFRESLYQKIRQKEMKQKEQSMKTASAEQNITKTQIMSVIDKVQEIYMARCTSNIPESILMEMLVKKLTYSTRIIQDILSRIYINAPQFLKKETCSGITILQVNKGLYNRARELLTKTFPA